MKRWGGQKGLKGGAVRPPALRCAVRAAAAAAAADAPAAACPLAQRPGPTAFLRSAPQLAPPREAWRRARGRLSALQHSTSDRGPPPPGLNGRDAHSIQRARRHRARAAYEPDRPRLPIAIAPGLPVPPSHARRYLQAIALLTWPSRARLGPRSRRGSLAKAASHFCGCAPADRFAVSLCCVVYALCRSQGCSAENSG